LDSTNEPLVGRSYYTTVLIVIKGDGA
jgi:hypothetical protein